MLDGNIFGVYTREEDDIGLYANAIKIARNKNLIDWMSHIPDDVKTFNVCKSWKDAQTLAKKWNEDFTANGLKRE